MNELVPVWLLVGNVLFVSVIAGIGLWVCRTAYRNSIEGIADDRKELHKRLKNAQDRIHAASLSDYMAIRDRPNVKLQSFSRTDEEEAAIEESRMDVSGMNGGF